MHGVWICTGKEMLVWAWPTPPPTSTSCFTPRPTHSPPLLLPSPSRSPPPSRPHRSTQPHRPPAGAAEGGVRECARALCHAHHPPQLGGALQGSRLSGQGVWGGAGGGKGCGYWVVGCKVTGLRLGLSASMRLRFQGSHVCAFHEEAGATGRGGCRGRGVPCTCPPACMCAHACMHT